MSFSKRAVHTLEGNETAIGVTDCHAYVDGQVMCLSQGSLDGPICFGKSNRHVVRLDGRGSVLRAAFNIPKGPYLVSWPKSGKSPHMKSTWEAALHRSTTTLWRCLTNLPPCRPFASVQVCVMPT